MTFKDKYINLLEQIMPYCAVIYDQTILYIIEYVEFLHKCIIRIAF